MLCVALLYRNDLLMIRYFVTYVCMFAYLDNTLFVAFVFLFFIFAFKSTCMPQTASTNKITIVFFSSSTLKFYFALHREDISLYRLTLTT